MMLPDFYTINWRIKIKFVFDYYLPFHKPDILYFLVIFYFLQPE
jgi:hypothetical protein